jgi:ELMO/CED-12 family
MAVLEKRLNAGSSLKKPFNINYSISKNPEDCNINLKNTENNKRRSAILDPSLNQDWKSPSSTFPKNLRRKNRFNTTETVTKLSKTAQTPSLLDISSPRVYKNIADVPLQFNYPFENTERKLKLTEEWPESNLGTPRFESKLAFEEENKEILEISSSKELSLPELLTNKAPVSCERYVSADMRNEDAHSQRDPSEYNGAEAKSDTKKLNESLDYTLESDRNADSPKIVIRRPQAFEKNLEIKNHSVRDSIPSKTQINYLDFDTALDKFNKLPIVSTRINLWHHSFWSKLCFCCNTSNNLSDELLEISEKIIIFAYSGFVPENIFHLSLLVSVLDSLQDICQSKGTWNEVGFSSSNPYTSDLKHDMSALGLILILFLYKYFPKTLQEMMKYALEKEIAFVLLAFDVAEIVIFTLREKKLNKFINQSGKCLEILFFLYAGCLASWFNLHKTKQQAYGKINKTIRGFARNNSLMMIDLAKVHLQKQ